MSKPKTITIDQEKYVREADVVQVPPNGNRKVVVVDRGWIYAGDVEQVNDGLCGPCIKLKRAVHLFRWENIGWARALVEWKGENVDCRKMGYDVEIPVGSIIHLIPVEDEWGIK